MAVVEFKTLGRRGGDVSEAWQNVFSSGCVREITIRSGDEWV